MQLTDTIESTFSDVASTVEATYATVAERTPAPVDKIVVRVGEVNVDAIVRTGRLTVRSVEAVGGVLRLVDSRTSGLTERMEEAGLRLVGRTPEEIDDVVDEATSRADATVKQAETVVDAVGGNAPEADHAYENWTKADLMERARELDVDGRSAMTKAQLIAALRAV